MYDIHEDNTTHDHSVEPGKWRSHSQGLDISLGFNDNANGGILIRGIASPPTFVNGPRRVINEIFSQLNIVTNPQQVFGLQKSKSPIRRTLFKTSRNGLANPTNFEYNLKNYRYFCDIDKWDTSHVSVAEKDRIRLNSILCP